MSAGEFKLTLQGYDVRTAEIDGPYRYRLTREWAPGGRIALVVMANPSTADAMKDDHTITCLRNLLRTAGYTGMVVVNLFAWRATQPVEMMTAANRGENIVGEANNRYIYEEMLRADAVVVAWGGSNWSAHHERIEVVRAMASELKKQLQCFGRTKDGAPRHPSRLPRGVKLEAYA